MDLLTDILIGVIAAATPLVFAAIGELVVEKSGVLNLGVEGMMIVGAIAAFAASVGTGSAAVGVMAAMLAGAAMATLFGFLTLTLQSNQVATGLALTMFGLGLSAPDRPGILRHDGRSLSAPRRRRCSRPCRWSASCCSPATRYSTCRSPLSWRCRVC